MLPNTYSHYRSTSNPVVRFMVRFDRPQPGSYFLVTHVYSVKLIGAYHINNSMTSWQRHGWHPSDDSIVSWERELQYRDEAKLLTTKIWSNLDFDKLEEALSI